MPVEMLHEGMTAEEIVEKFDVSPAATRVRLDTYVLTHWKFCLMILRHQVEAVATAPFLAEYQATIHYLLERYGGEHLRFSIMPIFAAMEVIPQTDSIHVCRAPDDDKFISCAVDGKCIYIVTGDQDLLSLGRYESVEMLTVAQFLDRLSNADTEE